ncbi:MAG: peptidoglycan DD-metalloendopeptidase family protein [Muribaculaceae bacterium]|nr:peptidoglycan DD-metalloendopeptidase family protein [Muribaculaceae bacterium]
MKRFFIILLTLVSVTIIFANKSQRSIKQEQQRTNKEISETTKKIDENKKQTREQVNQLNRLSAEIQEKSDSITYLKQSIDSIDGSMSLLSDSITKMESSLVLLRQKYGEVLRSIRKTRHTSNNVAFLFSSNTLSDVFRRTRYLRQFASWQNNKTNELQNAIMSVSNAKNHLVKLHTNKASSIKKVSATQAALQDNEKRQSQIIANLGEERASLEAYLKEKQQEARQLDAQLNKMIAQQQKEAEKRRKEEEKKRKEEEKRRKEEQKKALAQKKKEEQQKKKQQEKQQQEKQDKATKQESATPQEDVATSQPDTPKPSIEQGPTYDFERNKGRMPYPVLGKYRVVGKFGRQKHPQFPNIQTDNSGIDIELLSSGSAIAIFEGTVSAIFRQPGYNTIVMVRHGEYLSIYANLSSISVRTGDKVKANQVIGTVYANPEDDNRRIMHFEVRKETTKLNPQHWVK